MKEHSSKYILLKLLSKNDIVREQRGACYAQKLNPRFQRAYWNNKIPFVLVYAQNCFTFNRGCWRLIGFNYIYPTPVKRLCLG